MIELATLPPTVQTQILNIAKQPIPITDKGKVVAMVNLSPSYANGDFNFDLERMKQAVESGLTNPISVPKSALTDIDAFDKWLDEVAL